MRQKYFSNDAAIAVAISHSWYKSVDAMAAIEVNVVLQ